MSPSPTAAFLTALDKDDPKLAKALSKLADEPELPALLQRFQRADEAALSDESRGLAQRVLVLLARPSAKGIGLLSEALGYLDPNGKGRLTWDEMQLCVEILEMFCKADSVNDTLSQKELEMLLAVLQHLDTRGVGHLDEDARSKLRDALWMPEAFLDAQKATNPRLRAVLKLD